MNDGATQSESRTAGAENLSPPEVRRRQAERLSRLAAEVGHGNPFWQAKFAAAGVDAGGINSLDDLRRLPTTSKADLVEDQTRHPPYGSNLNLPREPYSRLHPTR